MAVRVHWAIGLKELPNLGEGSSYFRDVCYLHLPSPTPSYLFWIESALHLFQWIIPQIDPTAVWPSPLQTRYWLYWGWLLLYTHPRSFDRLFVSREHHCSVVLHHSLSHLNRENQESCGIAQESNDSAPVRINEMQGQQFVFLNF